MIVFRIARKRHFRPGENGETAEARNSSHLLLPSYNKKDLSLSPSPRKNHATMRREVCFERVSESEVLLRAGEGNNPSSFHLFGEQENTRQGNNAQRARGSKDARGEVISGKDQVLLSCLVRPTNDELLKRSSRIEPCVLVRMFRFKARKRKNELGAEGVVLLPRREKEK